MHTSVFIVSLSKWSLTFKIIPGVPPRIDLILLVLMCRVTPNNYKVVGTDTLSTSHQLYICMDIYVVHPKNYESKYTTIQCTKLYSPRFGLSTFCMSTFLVGRCFGISTFWFGLVCRCFGLSMFWSVDVSVCRRFGLLMFWYIDVSVCRRFGCRRFGLSTFWPVTYKRVHFDTPNPVYKYGHHFADDISEWISSMTFFIISLSLSFTS